MKKWLSILLSLVDITSTHAESYLKDFLTTKSGGVTKLFREHIKRGVRLGWHTCTTCTTCRVHLFIRLSCLYSVHVYT